MKIVRFKHYSTTYPDMDSPVDVIVDRVSAISGVKGPDGFEHAVLHLVGGEQISVTVSVDQAWSWLLYGG